MMLGGQLIRRRVREVHWSMTIAPRLALLAHAPSPPGWGGVTPSERQNRARLDRRAAGPVVENPVRRRLSAGRKGYARRHQTEQGGASQISGWLGVSRPSRRSVRRAAGPMASFQGLEDSVEHEARSVSPSHLVRQRSPPLASHLRQPTPPLAQRHVGPRIL